ncbi:MAG: hypothetical protein IH888_11765 [Planctomycetes bacterium]|nr:hypothetical protein [Planctomycetota bacterium]
MVTGDWDHDQDVDFGDFAELQVRFAGEGPTNVTPCCRIFDFELDDDVDVDDVVTCLDAVTGPSQGAGKLHSPCLVDWGGLEDVFTSPQLKSD